jgi:O-antigen/teichoic acid export membrane protein
MARPGPDLSAAEASPPGGRPVSRAAGGEPPGSPRSFRQTMLKGGRDLSAREIAGLVLSLAATVVIFRKVGPTAYGYIGLGLGLTGYMASVGSLGLNVFLIRRPRLGPEEQGQILTVVTCVAVLAACAVWFLAPVVETWAGKPGLVPMIRLAAPGIFFKLVGLVPTALLERNLRFRLAAGIDFASLGVYYAIALPAVLLGWSYMGIWAANVAQTVAATIVYFAFQPVRPSFRLRAVFIREALGYGVSYQASVWLYSLRDLAAPVLLPRMAGMDVLGVVTAGTQLVQRLGFFRGIVWRLSLSGLSRIQGDEPALRRSISAGMGFLAVLLGGALALFSSTSSWLVPLAITTQWNGVPGIFPFLAAASLVNGVFTMHSSALFARGEVWSVTRFHIVLVACLWGASLVLIPVGGMWGYAAAEMVCLAAYIPLARMTRTSIGAIDYTLVYLVLPLVAVPLFAGPWLPPAWSLALWAVTAGSAVLFSRRVRAILREAAGAGRRG